MKLYKQKDSPFWWYRFTINGKQIRKSTKRTDKREAEKVMRAAYSGDMDVEQLGAKPEITLADAFDEFISMTKGRTQEVHDLSKRKWLGLGKFHGKIWHLPADIKLHQLSERHLNDHILYRTREGRKPNYINKEIITIRAAHNRAKKAYRANIDLEFKTLPEYQKSRYLTQEEENALLKRLYQSNRLVDQRAGDLMVFLRDTGVRLGEALSTRWSDINVPARQVSVYRSKSRQRDNVTMTERLAAILSQRKDEGLPVPFPDPKPALLRLRKVMHEVCNQDSRIVNEHGAATPHSLRDTFASRLVQQGMSLEKIAKLLGHSNQRMTEKYAHLKRDAVLDEAKDLMRDQEDSFNQDWLKPLKGEDE